MFWHHDAPRTCARMTGVFDRELDEILDDLDEVATVTATATGYRVTFENAVMTMPYRVDSDKTGMELWAQAVQDAARFECGTITWEGWPDLDAAIHEYVAAGGELP